MDIKKLCQKCVFNKRWYNLKGLLTWIWHVSNFQILEAVILQDYKQPIYVITSKQLNLDSTTAPVFADSCFTFAKCIFCCTFWLISACVWNVLNLLDTKTHVIVFFHSNESEMCSGSHAEGEARLDGIVILQVPGSLSPALVSQTFFSAGWTGDVSQVRPLLNQMGNNENIVSRCSSGTFLISPWFYSTPSTAEIANKSQ